MREPIAREIIFAIGDNMREGLEPLLTKTLAPSLYQVYLHTDDFERIRTILPQIEEEAKEHLNRQLADLGRGVLPAMKRVRGRLSKRLPLSSLGKLGGRRAASEEPMKYVPAAGDWSIGFQEDPNERLERGEIEVISELAVADAPSYGSGSQTQRISPQDRPTSGSHKISVSTTRRLGQSKTERHSSEVAVDPLPPPPDTKPPDTKPPAATVPPAPPAAIPAAGSPRVADSTAPQGLAWAYVSYQDDRGSQRFAMTQEEIVIGRDASRAVADLRIRTQPDVSRRHAKIRRNPHTGGFWIEDLSQFGTEVNGRSLPQGVEVELPDAATIMLASVVTLEFAKGR